jgi:hypothetical protein
LDDPVLANGGRQIVKFRLIEVTPRIFRIAAHKLDRDHSVDVDRRFPAFHRVRLVHLSDKSGKAPPKASLRGIIVHCALLTLVTAEI